MNGRFLGMNGQAENFERTFRLIKGASPPPPR